MNMRKIIAVLAAVLMLCSVIPFSVATVSAAANDVVYDVDFENNSVNHWVSDSGSGLSVVPSSELPVANAACGNYVLKKEQPLGEYTFQEDRHGFAVQKNTDYIVTLDILCNKSNWPLHAYVSTGTWINGVLGQADWTSKANEWKTLTFTFNSGDNTKLYISFKSEWENCVLYVDNIKVAEPDPHRNVITNGDFETGDLTNWNKHETVTVEAAAAHDGNYGVHMKDRGTWGGILDQTVAVEAGKTYEISFWIKVNKFGINLQIKDGNANGAMLVTESTWFDYNNHSNWTQKTFTVTPSTNAIFLNFCGGGTSGTPDASKETDTYVDSITVRIPKEPSFDGYLYNGDFETGKTSNWTNLYNWSTVELVEGRDSDYAIKGTANGGYQPVYQQINVEQNTDYIVSAWAKNASNSALWIKGKTASGEVDITNKSFAGTGDTWTQTTVEFNSGSYDKVWISLMGISAGATYTVDDVVVLKKIAPSNDGYIVNGNFESGAKGNFETSQQTAITLDAAKDGNYGAELKGSGWGGLLGYTFAVEAGATYVLSYDAIALVNGFNSAVLSDTWQGEKLATKTFSSTSWTTIDLEFVATTNQCYLNLNGYSESGAVHCYVDNVRVVKIKDAHTHNYVGVETQAPTCTEDGIMTYSCTCGEGTYTEAIPAAHTYVDNCDMDCDVCGEWRDAPHNLTTHVEEVIPANCQEEGCSEYWICADCGGTFADNGWGGYYETNPAWLYYTGDHVRPEGAIVCAIVPCELCDEDTYGEACDRGDAPVCQDAPCVNCSEIVWGWGCNYNTGDEEIPLPLCQPGTCVYCGTEYEYLYECENGAWAPCQDGECSYGCGKQYPATENHVLEDCTVDGYCQLCWSYIPAGEHTYANAFDVDCDVCGAGREIALPIVDAGKSISEDVSGLAFRFSVTVSGLTVAEGTTNVADYEGATVNGYKLISMGAVASNGASTVDIPCVYLMALDEDSADFAVRIIKIPDANYDTEITAIPYFVVEIDGEQVTICGEEQVATYNQQAG